MINTYILSNAAGVTELADLRHWYGFYTPGLNDASSFPSFLRMTGDVANPGVTNKLMLQVEQGLPFFVGDDHEVLCSTPKSESGAVKCYYYGAKTGVEWYIPADNAHKSIFPYQY